MRQVRLLEEAIQEAIEAAAWNEERRTGLGRDFAQAIEVVLDLLEDDIAPLSPVPGRAGTLGAKRLILKRFPDDVIVQERPGEIAIVALAHHSRCPEYWRDRMYS